MEGQQGRSERERGGTWAGQTKVVNNLNANEKDTDNERGQQQRRMTSNFLAEHVTAHKG